MALENVTLRVKKKVWKRFVKKVKNEKKKIWDVLEQFIVKYLKNVNR